MSASLEALQRPASGPALGPALGAGAGHRLHLHIEAIVRENCERTEIGGKSESLGKAGLGGRRLQEVLPPPFHLFVSCPNPRLVLHIAAPHARAHAPSSA